MEKPAHTVNVTTVNSSDDDSRGLAVNLAAYAASRAQNLLDSSSKFLRERLVAHSAGDLDHVVEGHGLVVLDVLLLLAVARRLLQRLDDEGRGRGHNRNSRLAVLNRELDGHAQAFLCIRQQVSRRLGSKCDLPSRQ